MKYLLIGILIVVALAVIVPLSIYNGLVRLRNLVKNHFSQIEVQLKRRHDLIPNLVETVKGYMAHERDTLEAVIQARNQAMAASRQAESGQGTPSDIHHVVDAERSLSGALGRLFALSEAYPDLKSNQNMMQLNEELTSTENRVSFARQAYNDAVMKYNNAREVFPALLFAGLLGFRAAEPFELEDLSHHEVPKVGFL